MRNKIIVGLLTTIILAVIGYIASKVIIKYQDKRAIVIEFNQVVMLQRAVESCYLQTHKIEQCNSGEHDIPPEKSDDIGPMEVVNGNIYVAFVGPSVHRDLYGSAAQITFDTNRADNGSSPWVCKFQDNVRNKLSVSMLPKDANCTMRY